jgi:predicted transcriptional regulator
MAPAKVRSAIEGKFDRQRPYLFYKSLLSLSKVIPPPNVTRLVL